MTPLTKTLIAASSLLSLTLLGACSQTSQEWPTDKDIAPLLQQSLQMGMGGSFDGSQTKVVKVEISRIKCNDLEKGKVGCCYLAKATIHKFPRGTMTPEIRVLEEATSGTFVRRGDLWARG